MADDTDVSDREHDELGINPGISGDKSFKCCTKPCKVCICRNCSAIFHHSCTKRMKNIKIINEKTVECCEAKNEDDNEGYRSEIKSLKMEIHYLKLLVEEMRDKNKKKKTDDNGIIVPIIEITEEKENNDKNWKQPKSSQSYASRVGAKVGSSNEPKEDIQQMTSQSKQINLSTQQRIITRRQKSMNENKMIGTNIEEAVKRYGNTEDGNQYQNRKVNKRRMGTIGTGRETGNKDFGGVQKKLWIYIYRVNKTYTEDKVHTYIKQKTGLADNKIWTKEIPVKGNGLNRFVVTAPLDKKELLYSSDFWPAGSLNLLGINMVNKMMIWVIR
ncbi:uncharacterized protein LOC123673435 [Harmonia axyridis]|uniref:uncharacterized protein LOC123673435 n=1 Tax=Harmonia axyridis TaxID=115357 RepID=UPI001E27894C|nr:uncharacterized protein LOC123673435 [Harmonia axyridis]